MLFKIDLGKIKLATPIEIKVGIIIIFWGKIAINEKIIPFVPNCLIKKPVAYPSESPLKNINMNIKGTPIIDRPAMDKIEAVFRLFARVILNTSEESIVILSTLLTKALTWSKIF